LLKKINTVEYNPDKTFKRKKRRQRRYGYEVKQQSLKEFDAYYWDRNRMALTEAEQACFTRVEVYNVKTRNVSLKYVFTEPWRYVLKIAPHMVTHIKPLDLDIERELSYINDYIDNRMLTPRIDLLTRGRGYRYKNWFDERAKYINKLKNVPRYSQLADYLELET